MATIAQGEDGGRGRIGRVDGCHEAGERGREKRGELSEECEFLGDESLLRLSGSATEQTLL